MTTKRTTQSAILTLAESELEPHLRVSQTSILTLVKLPINISLISTQTSVLTLVQVFEEVVREARSRGWIIN